MIKYFSSVWGNNKFLKFGSVLMAGSLVVSLLNYIFTLVIGRMLGPALFGEVASIFSLAVLIGVPGATLTMFMTKQSAALSAHKEFSKLKQITELVQKYSLLVGLVFLALYFLLVPWLASFLRVQTAALIIFGLSVPLGLIVSVSSGFLMGVKDFVSISISNVIGGLTKLFLSVFLVWLGFAVSGVIGALVLSTAASYLYNYFQMRKKLPSLVPAQSEEKLKLNVASHLWLAFWASLSLALIGNIDIILAKHYLSADLAGQYAALSVMGKIILYGVGSFVSVALPMMAESHSLGDGKSRKHLGNSILLVSLLSLVAILVFALVPKVMVTILFGQKYLMITPYLVWAGLAMYFVAVTGILVNYFVAIHDRRFFGPVFLGISTQVILISFYHSGLADVVWVLVVSMFLLCLLLGATYLYTNRTKLCLSNQKN